MKNRIKEVRKSQGLTQVEFGEKIGVKGNTVTNYENGLRTPTDAVILSICREFKVNKEWLLTGDGDMFSERTKSQQIFDFLTTTAELPDNDFQKRFINALSKLDSRDWETLQKIVDNMQEG